MRVSERSFRIILNHADKAGLLRAAALGPTIHAELWKKYGDEGIPPDDAMKHHLLFDRNFNPEVVDGFIGQFKDTISFAKLDSIDKIADIEGGEDKQESPPGGEKEAVNQQGIGDSDKPKGQNQSLIGQKDFPLYLSNNKRAVLYIPATMTAKDYELLKNQIENHLIVIGATSVSEPEDQPKN
jgi:hypothetical protein